MDLGPQTILFLFVDSQMLTSTPTSLLTQIRHLYQDEEGEEKDSEVGEIFLKSESEIKNKDRNLIEEIDSNKRSIIGQNGQKSNILQKPSQNDKKSFEKIGENKKDRNGPHQKDRLSNILDDSILNGEGSLVGELKKIVPATDEELVMFLGT